MVRRSTKNTTGILRKEGISHRHAWASYTCINCGTRNYENMGLELPSPDEAFNNFQWQCSNCNYIHFNNNDLPFTEWPEETIDKTKTPAQRFWRAFFRSATEKPETYWKQCNVCGRILPSTEFAKHSGSAWGPLFKQMECRTCKAVINANLNPKRTTEQLRESSMKRRIAELLTSSADEKLNVPELFDRFDSKCFKTGIELNIEDSASWEIDHTLPSKYFYPLTIQNATLLSSSANQNKSGKWPSEYYTNEELTTLARITGASLELLSSREPIYNEDIDVNSCVEKFLNVRDRSDLSKRIKQLKLILDRHELLDKLNDENKQLLGVSEMKESV